MATQGDKTITCLIMDWTLTFEIPAMDSREYMTLCGDTTKEIPWLRVDLRNHGKRHGKILRTRYITASSTRNANAPLLAN